MKYWTALNYFLDHPYFVGVQYHPEYISRPLKPSPPYVGLIFAACGKLENYLSTKETYVQTDITKRSRTTSMSMVDIGVQNGDSHLDIKAHLSDLPEELLNGSCSPNKRTSDASTTSKKKKVSQ